MERLAGRIRSHALGTPGPRDSDLAAMTSDPAIRRELRQIEAEFAATEADGLSSE